MDTSPNEMTLLNRVLEIHSKTALARYLERISAGKWNVAAITRWLQGKAGPRLTEREYAAMLLLLPPRPAHYDRPAFDFIDLFAGIGGLRRGFEQAGGRCVLSCEWNAQALRTYRANHYADPAAHAFIGDIRDITLSHRENIPPKQVADHIRHLVPPHDVLLAGFPCQPFSIAGVSKKKSLGRLHGFEDKTQGTLFFDVARILQVMQPAAFVLENVKNLKSHDRGNTFRIIMETLDELGYHVADAEYSGSTDPKIIDARHFVPQHRERIVLAGLRRDLNVHEGFTLGDIRQLFPARPPRFGDILEPEVDDKYILTPALWTYLHHYALRHRARGNGFGYGLTGAADVARTLSARYYKDGSEILVDRGFDPALGFHHPRNQRNRPRRLTPRECARLMGFDSPQGSDFRIPVSDMQAYKQFGNSVVTPVFAAVAQLMKPRLLQAIRA